MYVQNVMQKSCKLDKDTQSKFNFFVILGAEMFTAQFKVTFINHQTIPFIER